MHHLIRVKVAFNRSCLPSTRRDVGKKRLRPLIDKNDAELAFMFRKQTSASDLRLSRPRDQRRLQYATWRASPSIKASSFLETIVLLRSLNHLFKFILLSLRFYSSFIIIRRNEDFYASYPSLHGHGCAGLRYGTRLLQQLCV